MMFLSLFILLFSVAANFQAEQPYFKGGKKYLDSYITNNLLYPEYSKSNCLQGTVNVSFKLDRDGKIFRSEVQKGFGTDLDDEALRIVRLTSGKWIVPSGYDTTTSIVLPVNFTLKNYNCETRNKDELKAAVLAYTARKDLTRAIYNFYDKKTTGQGNTTDEAEIIALKIQLGYDSKYINQLYKRGLRKLKQGDKESACEDLNAVRLLGSQLADKSISENCLK
jgi:TonB family protein